MKTPVDPVVRLQRRSVDDLRVKISAELTRLVHIDAACAAIDAEVDQQYHVAAADWAFSAQNFARRRKHERARLDAQRREAGHVLDRLRAEAAEAYGKLKAAEGAADRFRDDVRETEARAEQAAADDFALGRHVARIAREQARAQLGPQA